MSSDITTAVDRTGTLGAEPVDVGTRQASPPHSGAWAGAAESPEHATLPSRQAPSRLSIGEAEVTV